MMNGTINGTTNNDGISAKIVWSAVSSVDDNSSTITATLYYKRINGYTTWGTGDFAITIGDSTKSQSKFIEIVPGEWTVALTATATVPHSNDGTKIVEIRAEGGIIGTTLTTTTCSAKVELDTIPRASTLYSAATKLLGGKCNIQWYPKARSFRYRLKFELGTWSNTTGVIHPNTTALYQYTGYTLPLAVANQITTSAQGTMTVTLYTYSDESGAKLVGNADTTTFTVRVPNDSTTQPTLTFEIAPVSTLSASLASLYVQGKSRVKATALVGTAQYNADIVSKEFTVQGIRYPSPYTSDYLDTSGTVKVTARVTDSRGFYTEIKKEIFVLPYSEPSILPASDEIGIICARCYGDGSLAQDGTFLRIKARAKYSPVNHNGKQYNYASISYRYRLEDSKEFTTWTALSEVNNDTVDVKIPNIVTSLTSAYVVQISVADTVGGAYAYQVSIPTAFATVDIPEQYKGRSIGIFRFAAEPASGENRIDIDGFIHGGGIDNLTLGTMLTATAEAPMTLAATLTPGCYYSPNATNSQYITDSPYKEGGFGLEVRELQHKDYIRQTMYYGRTTIWRHYNGSVWSDWVRVMVSTEFETACTDFVIEQGESGGWKYKKWKGGTYEMFGLFEVTPTSSDINGTLYRTDAIKVTTPFKITDDAVVTGTGVGHYWLTNGVYASENAVSIRIMSDKTISLTKSITVRLHAVGTYA